MKTIAIRLEEDLHAQLSVIAQLSGTTITDEIRRAIEDRLAAVKSNPELSQRAEAVLADIQREAQARQQAIADLFATPTAAPSSPAAKSAAKKTSRTRQQSDKG